MVCRTLLRPVTEIESWKQKDSQPLQNASLNILVLKFKSLVKGVFKLRWRWSHRRKSIHPSKTSYTLNIPLHSLEMGITELPGLWQKKISQNTQKRLKKNISVSAAQYFLAIKQNATLWVLSLTLAVGVVDCVEVTTVHCEFGGLQTPLKGLPWHHLHISSHLTSSK